MLPNTTLLYLVVASAISNKKNAMEINSLVLTFYRRKQSGFDNTQDANENCLLLTIAYNANENAFTFANKREQKAA